MRELIVIAFSLACISLTACNNAVNEEKDKKEAPVNIESVSTSEEESESYMVEMKDHMMFESSSGDVKEFMERFDEGGQISWNYSSENRPNSIKLVVELKDGMEIVSFQSSPNEKYQIEFNKVGLTLVSPNERQEFVEVSEFKRIQNVPKSAYIGKWNDDGFVLQISEAGFNKMNVKCVKGQWNIDYVNADFLFKNGRIEFLTTGNEMNYLTLETDGRLVLTFGGPRPYYSYMEKL